MTDLDKLAARFRLDPPTPQARLAATNPEVAERASEIYSLARRFNVDLTWADAVRQAENEQGVTADDSK